MKIQKKMGGVGSVGGGGVWSVGGGGGLGWGSGWGGGQGGCKRRIQVFVKIRKKNFFFFFLGGGGGWFGGGGGRVRVDVNEELKFLKKFTKKIREGGSGEGGGGGLGVRVRGVSGWM